jgi:FtsZ-interacting cell division protein ZipA
LLLLWLLLLLLVVVVVVVAVVVKGVGEERGGYVRDACLEDLLSWRLTKHTKNQKPKTDPKRHKQTKKQTNHRKLGEEAAVRAEEMKANCDRLRVRLFGLYLGGLVGLLVDLVG